MSDDIVARLRNEQAYDEWNVGADGESVARDAADEIERMRHELVRFQSGVLDGAATVGRQQAEIERLKKQILVEVKENRALRDTLLRQADEIERLRARAAEDIIWMSGIGPIPEEGLTVWYEIQARWLGGEA